MNTLTKVTKVKALNKVSNMIWAIEEGGTHCENTAQEFNELVKVLGGSYESKEGEPMTLGMYYLILLTTKMNLKESLTEGGAAPPRTNFRVGDKVICVEGKNKFPVEGAIYTIDAAEFYEGHNLWYVGLEEDPNRPELPKFAAGWDISRFALVRRD
jgi:hypothetical protein